MKDVDEEIARLELSKKRGRLVQMIGTMALIAGALVGVIAMCLAAYHYDRSERNACIERGGRVERVRGGRGGWICLRP